MQSWVRSLTVLGAGFGGIVVVTLGLAGLLAPEGATAVGPTGSGAPLGSGAAAPSPPVLTGIPGLGGEITVTGDREGTLRLTQEVRQGGYALEGGGDRITFRGEPVQVAQVSYDGLEFFPDPEQCSITTGNLGNAIGIGFADLRCDDLVDVRGNGTVSLAGEIGLPVDLLVGRQLPPTGGSATVGEETWEFEEATLVTWQQPAIAGVSEYSLSLEDLGGPPRELNFSYDFENHVLNLANVRVGNTDADVPEGACSFDRTELGHHNPRTLVVELTISCPSVEVPSLGVVAISGSVVVDELQWPE
jgi:hypothetical protein